MCIRDSQYMAKDTYENNYFYDGSAALSEYTTSGNMTVANVFEMCIRDSN